MFVWPGDGIPGAGAGGGGDSFPFYTLGAALAVGDGRCMLLCPPDSVSLLTPLALAGGVCMLLTGWGMDFGKCIDLGRRVQ